MFNRKDSFSIEIPEDNSAIKHQLEIDNDLLVFTTDSIYKMLTAETIDPKETSLDTRHSSQRIYSVGTKSIFIARLIVQFNEIIKELYSYINIPKEKIITEIWNANKLIIDCFCVFQSIDNETSRLIPDCDNLITNNKDNTSIPPLPQVPELEKNVKLFFNNAKLFLIKSFEMFKIFFGMPFDGRNSSHFNKHLEWINGKFEDKHPIVNILKNDINWIRLISEIRNAFEHHREGQRVSIHNFEPKPGNKFSTPYWSFDLTNKLQKKEGNTDLIPNLKILLYNMLYFFEEILLLSIQDKLKNNDMLELGKISKGKIDEECPVAYRLAVKSSFLNKNKIE